jgi:hypothetical protein
MTWKEAIKKFAEQSDISKPLTNRIYELTDIMEQLILRRNQKSLYNTCCRTACYHCRCSEEKGILQTGRRVTKDS